MKMRVGDPGSMDVDIYLNDEKCDLCFEADEERGIALVYVNDYKKHIARYPNSFFQQSRDGYEPDMAMIKCKVEIRQKEAR